jgi:hypothetical protein
VAYDIWGYSPQVIQGADILATSDKDHQYQVFMPDFFDGEPCNRAWYVTSAPESPFDLIIYTIYGEIVS